MSVLATDNCWTAISLLDSEVIPEQVDEEVWECVGSIEGSTIMLDGEKEVEMIGKEPMIFCWVVNKYPKKCVQREVDPASNISQAWSSDSAAYMFENKMTL